MKRSDIIKKKHDQSSFDSFLEDKTIHVDKQDEQGNTLLHWAAQGGVKSVGIGIETFDPNADEKVKQLIEKGANPNAKNKLGDTSLHFALASYSLRFALASNRSHVDLEDEMQLQLAFHRFHLAIASHRLHRGTKPWAIEFLIDHGAKLEETNNVGDTPLLHLAKQENYKAEDCIELLACLIKRGADPNAKNKLGETPAFASIRSHGHHLMKKRTLDLLMEPQAGIHQAADINEKNDKERNATSDS